jgi:YggT family protein
MIKGIVQLLLTIYLLAVVVRIGSSFFPEYNHTEWMGYIAQATDPYLTLCRNYVPLVGGTIDLSPLAAVVALYLGRVILVKIL